MKTTAIILARMKSTRLPGKAMMEINGKPILELMIERVKQAKFVNHIRVATTLNSPEIIQWCHNNKVDYFLEEENNVFRRVLGASYDTDVVVDLTSDCPLICPLHIDECVQKILDYNYDYVSNCMVRSYPDGFDVQVYKSSLLQKTKQFVKSSHKSHSGWNIYNNKEKLGMDVLDLVAEDKYKFPEWGLTLDEMDDFILIEKIFKSFDDNKFTHKDVIELLKDNPEMLEINNSVKRKTPGEG